MPYNEKELVIQMTKSAYQHFKESGYPIKYSDYHDRREKDIKVVENLRAVQYTVPEHPSVLKYQLRRNLEKLGATTEEIYEIVGDIFGVEVDRLPKLQGKAVARAEEGLKAYQEKLFAQMDRKSEIRDNARNLTACEAREKEYHKRIKTLQEKVEILSKH